MYFIVFNKKKVKSSIINLVFSRLLNKVKIFFFFMFLQSIIYILFYVCDEGEQREKVYMKYFQVKKEFSIKSCVCGVFLGYI